MEIIAILLSSIVFFFLGRHTRFNKRQTETIDDIVEKIKAKPDPIIKPGVIPFRTQEQIEDEKSGDTALENHWKESGIADMIKNDKNKM